MKKLVILVALLSSTALGRLSNTSQQFSDALNLLSNPGFENSTANWETTGGATLGTTSVVGNVYVGSRSGVWDPSATGEFMRSRLASGVIPKGLDSKVCMASFWYLWDAGTTGQIHVNVNDGTNDLTSDVPLVKTSGEYSQALIRFGCPVQGTSIRIELESTVDAAALTVDQFFLGNDPTVLTNVLPIVAETSDTVTNLGTTGTFTHNGNVPVADQQWVATVSIDGGNDTQLDNGWIVDKADIDVDYDFTGLAGADVVTLKMFDTRINTPKANNLGLNFTYGPANVAPATSLAHGLGVIPRSLVVQHEAQTAPGEWDDITAANHCTFDFTNVNCDFTPITIDATHRIFVGVSTAINPSYYDGQEPKFGIGSNENDSYDPNADDLLIASTTTGVGITLKSESSGETRINMQDAVSASGSGSIKYLNVSNQLSFGTAGTEDKFRIDAAGNSQFGLVVTETTNSTNLMLGVGNTVAGPVIQSVENSQSLFSHNAYHTGGGVWHRRDVGETGVAMRLDAISGGVSFHIAAAGANPLSNWDSTDVKMKIQSDGDTVLTVQTDGCPDGGNVCSNSIVQACTPQTNITSCSIGQMNYTRVGNIVTGSIYGLMQPAVINTNSVFFLPSIPFTPTMTNNNQGSGTCVFQSNAGGVDSNSGTLWGSGNDLLITFRDVKHTGNDQFTCTFTYEIQ